MFVKPVNKFPCHRLALLLCLMHNSIFLSLPSSLHSFIPSLLPTFFHSFLLSFLPAASSYAIPCYFFWSNQSQPRSWPLYVISVSYFQIMCCGSCHKLIAQEPAQYAFGICAYIICCSLCYLQYRTHTHNILSLKDHTWITWVVTWTFLTFKLGDSQVYSLFSINSCTTDPWILSQELLLDLYLCRIMHLGRLLFTFYLLLFWLCAYCAWQQNSVYSPKNKVETDKSQNCAY